MKNTKIKIAAIIIVLISVVSLSKNLYSQWIQQQLPYSLDIVLSIDFTGTKKGLSSGWKIGGDGLVYAKLFSTSNSGVNWFLSEIPDSIRAIVGIEYVTPERVLMAGAYNTEMTVKSFSEQLSINDNPSVQRFYESIAMKGVFDYNAILLESTNAGIHWTPKLNLPPVCTYYYKTDFFDNSNGILIGTSQNIIAAYTVFIPHMMKTSDSGNTWNELSIPLDSGELRGAQFVNGNLIVTAGYEFDSHSSFPYKGVILISRDGGSNFSKSVFDEINNFTDIHFINSTTGFAIGVKNIDPGYPVGAVYKTTNGGFNWFSLNINVDSVLCQKIMFANNDPVAILIGTKRITKEESSQFIARTTDYGLTWSYQNRNANQFLISGIMLDSYNGFITGGANTDQGMILHTTNGGSTFINNNSTNSLNTFYLFQNFPNPFNPSTTISYYLSSNSFVTLKVYDVLGNEIRTLVDQRQTGGNYNVPFDGKDLVSGVYFYKLTTDEGFVETKKMVLTK